MQTYGGSCHCGAVRFEIETDLSKAIECNCSICSKKGALHHRVPAENFRLLAGKESLSLYQFGSKTAKHWFYSHCGIHPFSNPRMAPDDDFGVTHYAGVNNERYFSGRCRQRLRVFSEYRCSIAP